MEAEQTHDARNRRRPCVAFVRTALAVPQTDCRLPGFGDIIRAARKKRRWSQAELGEKSGLSRPTIALVEANNDLTTASIAKVAQALGLKLELR